ncbi:branched-chain amino acid ABC transporter permease [Actinomadura viridis]|uniref:Branched-chain amino acid transport system permease protein n=1 Tax=Actinomadura viridis TaxID=58110 RepID=A0A931GN95_9ACTN|nr:branched-chain amino acid ABC transporter permease [Actinomadura viridis]MBG6092750.1 branched-chain amino acid transport system permease protein [Actinomadura viridis]
MSEPSNPARLPNPARRPSWRGPRALALAAGLAVLLVLPFYAGSFWLQAGLFAMSAAVGAIGLNVLTGAAGQLSIGHAFFLAVGAYSYVWLAAEPETAAGHELSGLGLPTWLAAVAAVGLAGLAGGACAPLAGRLKGASLGVATLALVFIGQHVLFRAEPVTGGVNGRAVPPLELFGLRFTDVPQPALVLGVPFGGLERLWYLGLAVLLLSAWFARGVLRSRPGRALNTVRDNEIAAGALGVPVGRYRAAAFVLSSMYAGLAGVLLALVFQRTVPDYFGLALALDYLAMIVIGGLGSVGGAVLGAVFVSVLPSLLTRYGDAIPLVAEPGSGSGPSPAEAARLIYGAVFVAVLLFLPGGLLGLAARARRRRAAPPRNGPGGRNQAPPHTSPETEEQPA